MCGCGCGWAKAICGQPRPTPMREAIRCGSPGMRARACAGPSARARVVHVRGTCMMAARVPRRVPRRVPPRGCVCAWEGSGGEEDHRAHFDWGKVWAGFPCGRSHCGRAVVVRVCARCGFRCPRAARGRAVGLLGRGRRGRANGVPEITSFWLSVVRPEYKPINKFSVRNHKGIPTKPNKNLS